MGNTASDHVLMISSDGHATARMDDYRPYIPASHREEFDAFCAVYREKGTRINEPEGMKRVFDPEIVAKWIENVTDRGRLEGTWDVKERLGEMAVAGLAAEVLFPDFGIAFELYTPSVAAVHGYVRTPEQIEIANHAYNRWLADFCSEAPDRFAGMALMTFDDVDAAVDEIRWAKQAGLRGVLLPMFSAAAPVFDPKFDPIWSTLVELEMPANSHSAVSGVLELQPLPPTIPHPAVVAPYMTQYVFFSCHQLLNQLIWGGVLERHPELQVVFTEQGSGWVIGALQGMDYTWDSSFAPRTAHELVKHLPSEYFRRQCHLGSSIFSRAEVEARHEIGIDRMTLGMDYPHPEGTWGIGPGHIEYLQATIGAAHVPPDEARMLVGENALKLWGFDREALQPIVDDIGPSMDTILRVPDQDHFPRGDVHKPLAQAR